MAVFRNLDVEEIHKRQMKAEELRLMLQEKKANCLRILHLKVSQLILIDIEIDMECLGRRCP